jgi:hypothetical protein
MLPCAKSEGFPSGQRDQTVNLTAQLSQVRILPPPPVGFIAVKMFCGCSSMVEPQPSKLMVWVRFPLPAPRILLIACPHSSVVEHFLGKEEVTGSIPVVGSSTW